MGGGAAGLRNSGVAELAEEAVVDGLDGAVRVPLVHQNGHLDLAGGDHLDVDAGGVQGLEHLGGHAGVVGHGRRPRWTPWPHGRPPGWT